ncbi:MAG: phosphatidate cytidylyltransferase [Candidatus Cryptobacteroides sp.]
MKSLLKRSISGVIYALTVAVGLIGPQPLFVLVFAFALVYSLHEFFRMAMGRKLILSRVFLSVSVLWLFLSLYLSRLGYCIQAWAYLALIPLLIAFIVPVWTKEKSQMQELSYACAGLLCVGLPLALSPVLTVRGGQYSGFFLLCIFIITALSDVGAYMLGSLLGQREGAWKLAPKISPKKSWWGVLGGLIMAVGASLLLRLVGWIDLDILHCICLGTLLSIVGVLGDLLESMWKRHFSVKDSGNLIPGHGGLYDRLDSVLPAILLSIDYLEFFALL